MDRWRSYRRRRRDVAPAELRLAERLISTININIKHSAPLAPVTPVQEAKDVIERGLADAVVVTGESTSVAADIDVIGQVSEAVSVPVYVGSGVTPQTAPELRKRVGGIIVGSTMMRDG